MTSIPVLCFHKITTDFEWGLTTYAPKRFETLITSLLKRNYNFCLPEKISEHSKPIILTFDDGYASITENALPFLQKRDIPFIVFPIINFIGEQNDWDVNLGGIKFIHLDLEQLKNLKMNGGGIGSHGMSHTAFSNLTTEERIEEVEKSFDFLRKGLDVHYRYFSTPYGETLKDEKIIAKIDFNFILDNKCWDGQSKTVSRIPVYRYETPEMIIKKIENPGFNNWLAGKIHLGSKASVLWQKKLG